MIKRRTFCDLTIGVEFEQKKDVGDSESDCQLVSTTASSVDDNDAQIPSSTPATNATAAASKGASAAVSSQQPPPKAPSWAGAANDTKNQIVQRDGV